MCRGSIFFLFVLGGGEGMRKEKGGSVPREGCYDGVGVGDQKGGDWTGDPNQRVDGVIKGGIV